MPPCIRSLFKLYLCKLLQICAGTTKLKVVNFALWKLNKEIVLVKAKEEGVQAPTEIKVVTNLQRHRRQKIFIFIVHHHETQAY